MRSLLIASAAVALLAAGDAGAQRVVARGPGVSYPAPGMGGYAPVSRAPLAARPVLASRPIGGQPSRWGGKVGGRWSAGVYAPGGWNGYSRPYRGWALPTYWNSPSFVVSDWSSFGLSRPPYGYRWSRYYDDAVLIDSRGSVFDSVGNVDWDGGNTVTEYGDDYAYDDGVYAGPDERRYSPPPASYPRRDNGVGGAVTGAVVGGVAGNLIAGRGNRLGGTLIGAGVGAAAGYAVDKHEDDRRAPPPPPRGYDRGYDHAAPRVTYAPPPSHFRGGQNGTWVSPDGGTRVITSGSGYGGSTTVVTVQTAPVVTTTTEVYEDTVTYSRPKKVYRKHVWRPKPRCACR